VDYGARVTALNQLVADGDYAAAEPALWKLFEESNRGWVHAGQAGELMPLLMVLDTLYLNRGESDSPKRRKALQYEVKTQPQCKPDYLPYVGRARVELAEFLVREGDAAKAKTHLDEALAIFTAHGSPLPRDRSKAQELLAALGFAPTPPTPPVPPPPPVAPAAPPLPVKAAGPRVSPVRKMPPHSAPAPVAPRQPASAPSAPDHIRSTRLAVIGFFVLSAVFGALSSVDYDPSAISTTVNRRVGALPGGVAPKTKDAASVTGISWVYTRLSFAGFALWNTGGAWAGFIDAKHYVPIDEKTLRGLYEAAGEQFPAVPQLPAVDRWGGKLVLALYAALFAWRGRRTESP
jgi:hypothetical protein